MELTTVKIENPDNLNLILGHSHFIKTVEDIYEAMVNGVPMAKFGLAFCEASEACLVRYSGTQPVCRVMVEASTIEEANKHSREIVDIINKQIGR